jgi:hypothetical protein
MFPYAKGTLKWVYTSYLIVGGFLVAIYFANYLNLEVLTASTWTIQLLDLVQLGLLIGMVTAVCFLGYGVLQGITGQMEWGNGSYGIGFLKSAAMHIVILLALFYVSTLVEPILIGTTSETNDAQTIPYNR